MILHIVCYFFAYIPDREISDCNKCSKPCTRMISTNNSDSNFVEVQPISRHSIDAMVNDIGGESIVVARELSGYVQLQLNTGEVSMFPTSWLRDNCQCNNCFNHQAEGRSLLMQDYDVNPAIKDVSVLMSGKLDIEWLDGHRSEFSWNWLKNRSFNDNSRKSYREKYQLPKVIIFKYVDFFINSNFLSIVE